MLELWKTWRSGTCGLSESGAKGVGPISDLATCICSGQTETPIVRLTHVIAGEGSKTKGTMFERRKCCDGKAQSVGGGCEAHIVSIQ